MAAQLSLAKWWNLLSPLDLMEQRTALGASEVVEEPVDHRPDAIPRHPGHVWVTRTRGCVSNQCPGGSGSGSVASRTCDLARIERGAQRDHVDERASRDVDDMHPALHTRYDGRVDHPFGALRPRRGEHDMIAIEDEFIHGGHDLDIRNRAG